MHITRTSAAGHVIIISVTQRAKARLKNTCFRAREPLAGNFSDWVSAGNFVGTKWVYEELLEHADELIKLGEDGTHSATLESPDGSMVGWESTDKQERYADIESQLEAFQPNRRSNALRVPLCMAEDYQAPVTNKVTIIFEFRQTEGESRYLLIIHSVYPGEDIGELLGDVTEREGRVFFDWNHPGEALA